GRTEVSERVTSKWLGPFLYEYWGWFIRPFEDLFIKLKFTPNLLTTAGFVLSVGSAYAFATGHFGIAGWLMIIGGSCDMFDGRIARRTGQSTKAGAFYDSVMDRFGEAVVYLGLVIYFRHSWVLYAVIVALIGSMMVSYMRAKGDSMGIDCKVGAMQRAERIVYLGVGAIFSPPFRQIVNPTATEPVEYLAIAAIIFIAVMTIATALYRMIYMIHKLRKTDGNRPKEARSLLVKKLTARYLDI
ncbi:MAG: CDP-alcohol phosphatidyltransferase family protein, partial [bacterium]|nr:CDP-alcohol phosphatidyltransferase family protein [bacterium]